MKEFFSLKYILPLSILLIYVITSSYNFYNTEIIGIILFFYFLLKLIYNINLELSIKEIFLALLLLQYFLSPLVVYYKFDNDVGDFGYEMKINNYEYFSFLTGSILAITAGLYVPIFKKEIEITTLIERIKKIPDNFNIGFILIIIGFVSYLIALILPSSLSFLAIFLVNLKYVGMFYIYYSNNPYRYLFIVLVLAYLILNIISGGVFIDLFVWGLFFTSYFSINKKIPLIFKIAVLVIGVFTALLVQSIKADYRKVIWSDDNSNEDIKEEFVFVNLANTKLQNATSLLSDDNLKSFFSRINQGWILSNVLEHVPKNQDFANGDLFIRELKGIILPRIIAPDKITASGKDVKEKFMKYTGRILIGNTTMNVGLISDGYINFGKYGSWIFMFFIGLFLNFYLNKIISISQKYPTLILWLPVLFFYIIRSGNDFYMIMNYLVKSTMLIAVAFYIFKNVFYKPNIE